MALIISIDSVRCLLESAVGRFKNIRKRRRRRASDEVAFFVAFLGVNKRGSTNSADWEYTESRSFEVRAITDVDSGEYHRFQSPILMEMDATINDFVEIRTFGFEMDGIGKSLSLAERIRDNAIEIMNRSLPVGGIIDQGVTIHDYSPLGGRNHMLWLDTWYVDTTFPLTGSQPPLGDGTWISMRRKRARKNVKLLSTEQFPITADRYIIERKTYSSYIRGEYNVSKYSFDTTYRIT